MAYSSLVLLAVLAAASLAADPSDPNASADADKEVAKLSKEVVIQLFTRQNTEEGEVLDVEQPDLLSASLFDPLVPTKIITHGWLSGQKRSAGAGGPLLKDAILEVSPYNVILVDWSKADSINYISARLQVKTLGRLVGALVAQLVDVGGMEASDLHLIGHSLGAHIMGFAGRTARLGKEGRITALDPAGPLFWNNPEVRLDKTDAGFVDVIHTSSGYLGYWDPLGHADFYPNGGTWVQAGCGFDIGKAKDDNGSDDYHRQHVRLHFFCASTADTKKGTQFLRDLNKDDILDDGYVPHYPTKVLIHGFNNDVTSKSMQLIKNAYFKALNGRVNVIVVDWSDLNPAPFYFSGYGNIDGVARRVAELLDFMVGESILDLNKLHIIGHSLGAHVAGVTAEHLTSGTVKRITGLDPARPLINMQKESGRLSQDDAALVDVIHTNAGLLGEQAASGHIDFYPNGGKSQPGCSFDLVGACSHGRSYYFFAESIATPNAFKGWLCADEWDALHGTCADEESTVTAILGDHVSFSEPGAYYLETASSSPYGKSA